MAKQKIKIWDLPVRLFHWTLAPLIFFMWLSASQGWFKWHFLCGLFILALVLFRLMWGVVGSDTARFSQFVHPSQIKCYLKHQISESEQPGHNPLGALMVLALLGGILFQVASGLFASDEDSYVYHGYLQHFVSDKFGTLAHNIHVNFFWILIGLIGLHILAVFLYKWVRKINLITPMITGKKWLTPPLPILKFTSNSKALMIFVVALIISYSIKFLS